MSNYQDFGFAGDEYTGELTTPPYCQFLNAGSKNYGIAITPANAQLAEFQATDAWQAIEHEFSDGTVEMLLVTQQPRLLILNRSMPLMSDDTETIAYNKSKFQSGSYKAFSYIVVWFVDNLNQPLSKLPFRLKCSGYSGYTFLKNYAGSFASKSRQRRSAPLALHYNNPNSFCNKFLATYKTLTGDRAINKNDVFCAHGVYQPTLTRQKATSSVNGQSSFAVRDAIASLVV